MEIMPTLEELIREVPGFSEEEIAVLVAVWEPAFQQEIRSLLLDRQFGGGGEAALFVERLDLRRATAVARAAVREVLAAVAAKRDARLQT